MVRYNSDTDMLQIYFNDEWIDCINANVQSKALIPILTANTSNLIYDTYTSDYATYKAFDNDVTTHWRSNAANGTGYIGYMFNTPAKVTKIKLRNTMYSGNARCKEFVFQYSDDKSNWFDLTSTLTIPNDDNEHEIEIENISTHMYYRVYIKSIYGSDQSLSVALAELQMYGN